MLRLVSLPALLALCLLLSGCALPVPLKIASWAVDGISYLTTQKSVLDHGLSAMNGQDCAVLRMATEGKACRNHTPGVDFDGDLALQASGGFSANAPVCDIPRISEELPNNSELHQCAKLLIDTYGENGAIDHCDRRITHLIGARKTDSAGVWIGIQVAVRQVIANAPQTAQAVHGSQSVRQ